MVPSGSPRDPCLSPKLLPYYCGALTSVPHQHPRAHRRLVWTHGNSSPRGAPSGSTAHRHPQFEQRTELLTETAPQPCAHRRVTTICAQCASPSRETSALPSSVPSSTPRVAPTSRPTSGPDIWSPFAWLRLLSLSLCPMAHQAWHQDDTSECCAQHETKCSPIVTLTLTPTAERQGSSPRGAAPS
jgi:hypothetical protein